MEEHRRFAAATERNREPICRVMEGLLPAGARVLEVAAGTGQHAVYLASRLPVASWLPTDADASNLLSIEAWRLHSAEPRVLPARPLDVEQEPWPVSDVDHLVCINMIHIAPWSAALALLRGAARSLPAGGLLFLYGPYRRGGEHTSASNAAFDSSLRERDPAWGVRDLEAVLAEGRQVGLAETDVIEMPANNLSVVLTRTA